MEDSKTHERKGWAILTAKNALAATLYILKLASIIMLGVLISYSADMHRRYGGELMDLVDAGTLPDCLYYYPLGMFGMLAGLIMILFILRRK